MSKWHVVQTDGRPQDDCTLAVGSKELVGINCQSNTSSSILNGVVRGRPDWKQANQVLHMI